MCCQKRCQYIQHFVLLVQANYTPLCVQFQYFKGLAIGSAVFKVFRTYPPLFFSACFPLLICKYMVIPYQLMIIIALVCNICLLLYAPADTYKRPLVNAKKRKRFKFMSVILGIIYTILIIIFRDYLIVNYLLIPFLSLSPIKFMFIYMLYSTKKEDMLLTYPPLICYKLLLELH